jgi:hypothetical protein
MSRRRIRRSKGNVPLIKGAFAPYSIDMLSSPAWRVLSQSAYRVLARIDIEHSNHKGKRNNHLKITFDAFQTYGIDRHSIAPAIRLATVLGFVRFRPGRAGNAEFRRAGMFGLTYRNTYDESNANDPWREPTNEWRLVKTLEQAEAMAKKVSFKKQKPSVGKRTIHGGESHTENVDFHGGESHTTAIVEKPTLLSRSTPTPGVRISGDVAGGVLSKPSLPRIRLIPKTVNVTATEMNRKTK